MMAVMANRSQATRRLNADEAELLERIGKGDRLAERQFYDRYKRQVTATIIRVMGHDTDLEDIIQEVFVVAFTSLPRFRGDARLSTWLYRVTVNVALGKIRYRSRRPRLLLHPEKARRDGVADTKTPLRLLETKQDEALCHRVLASLPPKKRVVLYLYEFRDLDLKEIAYIVDANPVTVRTRLFYARREFHKRAVEALAAEEESA
jgi:RNA polymerase sigma-70 factor (ECF subfamily)